MFAQICFWSTLLVIFLAGIAYAISLKVRTAKARNGLKYHEECEIIRIALAGKKFSVWIRTQKEKKTDMETALIGRMVDHGLTVVDKRFDEIPEPPEGVIAIRGAYNFVVDITGNTHYLDMRAVSIDSETKVAQLRAARHFSGNSMEAVAHAVLLYLSEVLK